MNKRFVKILSAAAMCAAVLGSAAVQAAAPSYFDDDEMGVRLRLKNELRRADKPSAGAAKDIYAWVQGAMLEADSGWINDFIGFEGGYYYVAKLAAPEHMTTRWYLEDHSSFGYWAAAVKFRYQDLLKLKVGRFITDSAYGSLPYYVPLINSDSNRTLPAASQGALLYLHPTSYLDLWMMWRNKVFLAGSGNQGGFRDEGVYNSADNDYDPQRDRYFFAFSLYNDDTRFSSGYSYQDAVGHQYQVNFDTVLMRDEKQSVSTNLRYFGGSVIGSTTKELTAASNYNYTTNLYTGRVAWTQPYGTLYAAFTYTQHATFGNAIDSDLGFVNSFSMDRNHERMWAFEVGYILPLGNGFSVMLDPVITHGYEDNTKNVEIEGYGLNYGIMYRAKGGPLDGLRFNLFGDWAMERRYGSTNAYYGDRLHYWDVKMTIQYDIDLFK